MSQKLLVLLALAPLALAGDPNLLGLVMPDATVVFGADVDRIKASEVGKALLTGLDAPGAQMKEWIEATGFDPLRDLHEVIVAAPAGKDQKRGVVLLRGSFDPARIPGLARRSGAQLTSHQGLPVITVQQDEPLSITCLDSSTAVMGDPESVRAVIARRGFSSRIDPKLYEKASELSGKLDVWFTTVVSASDLAREIQDKNLSGMLKGDVLKSVEHASGGLTLGSSVQFSLEVGTRTEQDAVALRDVLQFFGGLALTNARRPRSRNPLDDLKIQVEGNSLKLALAIPNQEIARMIETQRKVLETRRRKAQAAEAAAQPAPENPGTIVIHSSPADMGVVTLPTKP